MYQFPPLYLEKSVLDEDWWVQWQVDPLFGADWVPPTGLAIWTESISNSSIG
jgi:hypothetical protein